MFCIVHYNTLIVCKLQQARHMESADNIWAVEAAEPVSQNLTLTKLQTE